MLVAVRFLNKRALHILFSVYHIVNANVKIRSKLKCFISVHPSDAQTCEKNTDICVRFVVSI